MNEEDGAFDWRIAQVISLIFQSETRSSIGRMLCDLRSSSERVLGHEDVGWSSEITCRIFRVWTVVDGSFIVIAEAGCWSCSSRPEESEVWLLCPEHNHHNRCLSRHALKWIVADTFLRTERARFSNESTIKLSSTSCSGELVLPCANNVIKTAVCHNDRVWLASQIHNDTEVYD